MNFQNNRQQDEVRGDQESSAEVDILIQKVLERTSDGLTFTSLQKALPSAYGRSVLELKKRLQDLAARGTVFEWPGRFRRYALRPYEDFVRERIVDLLRGEKPLTRSQLVKKLPGAARRLRLTSLLEELIAAGRIYRHPRLRRSERFAANPPDALIYLRREFDGLINYAKKQGFSPDVVREALQRYFAGSTLERVADDGLILEAMRQLNPHAGRGALVFLPELRRAVRDWYPDKTSFDQAVLRLAERGIVQLQSHDWPAVLDAGEREAMIEDGRGSYFMAIGLRVE